ncbi:hypothetical protein C7B67_14085 [filamentous cyanobacterium Phorm 6]|nr:hypothetical protein C7B67_14085 [filamentous cyanobacterium Phorm 6]
MKPWVGAIHELPLPKVVAIAQLMNHTQNQQRPNVYVCADTADSAFMQYKPDRYIPLGTRHCHVPTTYVELT